jgi:hypothetical protein
MICIAVLAFAQPSLRSAWSCKEVIVRVHRMWILHLDGWLAPPPPRPLLLRNPSRYTTPREEQKGIVEILKDSVLCVLCVRTGKSRIRSDPRQRQRQCPKAANTPESCCHVDPSKSLLHLPAGDTNLRQGGNCGRSSQLAADQHPLEAAATTHRCGPRLQAHARTHREEN